MKPLNFSFVNLLGEQELILRQLLGEPITSVSKEGCQVLKYIVNETYQISVGIKNDIVVSLTVSGYFSEIHHAIEFIGISFSSLTLLNENQSFQFFASNETGDRVSIKKEKNHIRTISVLGQIANRSSQGERIYHLRDKILMAGKDKTQSITLDGFLQELINLYSKKSISDNFSSLRLINGYGFQFQNQDTVNMLVDYVSTCAQKLSPS